MIEPPSPRQLERHGEAVRVEMELRIRHWLTLGPTEREIRREHYRNVLKYGLPDVKNHNEWV